MGFERFHPEPIVQRNLITARELRSAYLRDLRAWIKTSIKGGDGRRLETERKADLPNSQSTIQ